MAFSMGLDCTATPVAELLSVNALNEFSFLCHQIQRCSATVVLRSWKKWACDTKSTFEVSVFPIISVLVMTISDGGLVVSDCISSQRSCISELVDTSGPQRPSKPCACGVPLPRGGLQEPLDEVAFS